MASFSSSRRTKIGFWLAPACAALLSSCATVTPGASSSRAVYRVYWTATRASDHSPLIAVSMKVPLGQTATINTDSTQPAEKQPAFPRFRAQLSPTKNPGVLELVTRASLREVSRNKKGKLRRRKRDIGALIPIRPGETQVVSESNDAVHLEVRLVRE